MRDIEPDMVLGKEAVDPQGATLGEIVDVGLYAPDRVKFLVLKDPTRRVAVGSPDGTEKVPPTVRASFRTVGVDLISDVSADRVRLSVV